MGQNNHSFRHQSWKDGRGEVLPHLVETETSAFELGVAPLRAHQIEIVLAIARCDIVEDGGARVIRSADERMECKRGRAVALREAPDDVLETLGQMFAHGALRV